MTGTSSIEVHGRKSHPDDRATRWEIVEREERPGNVENWLLAVVFTSEEHAHALAERIRADVAKVDV